MDWQITYDEQLHAVKVTVEGDIVASLTARMAVEGIEFARGKGCTRFLIDYRRTAVGDSTTDTYRFMKDLGKLGITRRDSIAIVYPPDSADDHRFAETVAANRGWGSVRYFLDPEDAATWLAGGRP